jgi:transcriptional regulator with XRE-family HTH domain
MALHALDVDALYGALDRNRDRNDLSWRDVAAETGISASTLTRIGQGRHPDADALCSLVMWLGVSLREFIQAAPREAS